MTVTTVTPDPYVLVVRRQVRPGDGVAHLFSDRPGWTRSLCRATPWTIALVAAGDVPACRDCEQVRAALEAVPETEERLLHGDR